MELHGLLESYSTSEDSVARWGGVIRGKRSLKICSCDMEDVHVANRTGRF